MPIYGYCRVSTSKQNIERQVRNILAIYPMAVIIREVYTRTVINRKEWTKLFEKVKSGDTIVFDSVSRLSGNAEEGFATYQELYNRGVNLIFLKEPHINTETYKKALDSLIQLTGTEIDYILAGVNKYLLSLAREQIRLAFIQSEKEVEDLHQRTKEGIETARLNGKQIGRARGSKIITKKSLEMKERIRKMSKSFDGNMSDKEILEILNISRNTYYKYKKEMQ
jgi:DNA invertase Pin-like site-specific DNA recombinase